MPLPLPMSVQPFERASLCQALKLACRGILVQVSVFIWAFTAWSVLCMEGLGNDCAGGYWGGELEYNMCIWGLGISVFCYVLWAAIVPYVSSCLHPEETLLHASLSHGLRTPEEAQALIRPVLARWICMRR